MTFEPSDKTCNDVESFLDSVLEAQHCNTGETFILCRLCGEWDSHAETCPVPAVQAWQTGEIPVLSAKGHELRDAAASSFAAKKDAPAPTCGMCSNWMTNHGSGWDKRHPCHFYGGVPRTADDGCIVGYTPKGDVR